MPGIGWQGEMAKKKSQRIELGVTGQPGQTVSNGGSKAGSKGGSKAGSKKGPAAPGLTHNPFASLRGSLGPVEEEAHAETATPTEPLSTQPTLSGGSVIVRRERKGHGGKTVTVADLSRVEWGQNHDLGQVAKSLRKALGAGARAQDQCITVQGDQVERVAAFFTENFGAKVVLGTRK